jgi:hypothetical protein
MAGSIPDEDEEVLTLDEQTRRPLNTALRQQRIAAWNPYLDPWWVVATFLVLAAIFIPVGFKIQSMSNQVVEIRVEYDRWNDPNPLCGIGQTPNANVNCTLRFNVTKDMEPPILVHYELSNFYQNHRDYVKSRDNYQLLGSLTQTRQQALVCEPLNKLGNITLNPCGFIANTLFNDVFTLANTEFLMQEKGIAWASDLEYMFAQPEGFQAEPCPNGDCSAACCEGDEWSCEVPYQNKEDEQCYRYFYPNDNTTQYLYETYPQVVSPLEGVTNEHFVVWMRIAALPTFRKLYGYIEVPIPAGTILEFNVNANFEITSFEGSKALIISTNNMFGGRNVWLGSFFYVSGFICLGLGLFFGWKQQVRPRKIADKSYLHFKLD